MKTLYPLGCPVIVDSLAYERADREQATDPEPHQYVGTVRGFATLTDAAGWTDLLYVVTLCSPDRFDDPKRENGAHVSQLLVNERSLLHDVRESVLDRDAKETAT